MGGLELGCALVRGNLLDLLPRDFSKWAEPETFWPAGRSRKRLGKRIYQEIATGLEGYALKPEDVARLSPLTFDHINFLGRYAFALPDSVAQCQLRPLRSPDAPEDE